MHVYEILANNGKKARPFHGFRIDEYNQPIPLFRWDHEIDSIKEKYRADELDLGYRTIRSPNMRDNAIRSVFAAIRPTHPDAILKRVI